MQRAFRLRPEHSAFASTGGIVPLRALDRIHRSVITGMVGDEMSKRRREIHEDDSPTWVVSRAAKDAAAMQDEIVDLVATSQALLETMVASGNALYRETFRTLSGKGHSHSQAHEGSLLVLNQFQCDDFVLNSRQPVTDNARLQLHRDAETVRSADLFIVSPVMHAMAIAAASTLTDDDLRLWREDDLPSLGGFVVFPAPLKFQHHPGKVPDDVIGVSWRRGTVYIQGDEGPRTANSAVFATIWVDLTAADEQGPYQGPLRRARELGERFPTLVPGHYGYCALEPSGSTPLADPDLIEVPSTLLADSVGEYSGEAVTGEPIAIWSSKYLFALSRLLQQPKQASERRYAAGIDPRIKPRPHHAVRVVHARRAESDSAESEKQSPRTYSHRFTVRMHKVNQRYPKQGINRIIWRGPYVKGPADAPMLPGRKVHHLG